MKSAERTTMQAETPANENLEFESICNGRGGQNPLTGQQ